MKKIILAVFILTHIACGKDPAKFDASEITDIILSNNQLAVADSTGTIVGIFSVDGSHSLANLSYVPVNDFSYGKGWQVFSIDGKKLIITANNSENFEKGRLKNTVGSPIKIKVRASDGFNSHEKEFSINVLPFNSITEITLGQDSLFNQQGYSIRLVLTGQIGQTFSTELVSGTGDTHNQNFIIASDEKSLELIKEIPNITAYMVRVKVDDGFSVYEQNLLIPAKE